MKFLIIIYVIYQNNRTLMILKIQIFRFLNIDFDSFIIPPNQFLLNKFSLLDVDNRCTLSFNYPIPILNSSLEIKIDSTPGRPNQTLLLIRRPGIFFSQYPKICSGNLCSCSIKWTHESDVLRKRAQSGSVCRERRTLTPAAPVRPYALTFGHGT
ncbi:Cytochrome c oxidase subunit 2 [Trachymyrmex septentrionalis]|uniref:Cytochrome c oxidase subunit 2 n=1 Tax=Trachymyrmex septentrionalis TaxID=34720 RepID=A0A151JSN2_9HYME|nr:Cytochrome c oxidase subunit 2 [Trachymyrmex septentrionalis]